MMLLAELAVQINKTFMWALDIRMLRGIDWNSAANQWPHVASAVRANGGGAHEFAGLPLAAMGRQVRQKFIHGREGGAVDQVTASALLGDQSGMVELFQVEGQGRWRQAQLFRESGGRHSLRPRNDQLPEDL